VLAGKLLLYSSRNPTLWAVFDGQHGRTDLKSKKMVTIHYITCYVGLVAFSEGTPTRGVHQLLLFCHDRDVRGTGATAGCEIRIDQ
jgi:hypothetical protein